MSLYKVIEAEMKRQGHEVFVLQDYHSTYDPTNEQRFPIRQVRSLLWKYEMKRYWKNIINSQTELSAKFDVLFVLTGCSITSDIINHLKKTSPGIRKILYTWDTINAYPFDRLLPFFDKAYSFDIVDVSSDSRWKLLPIFYEKDPDTFKEKFEYDLFSIGTNHSGRYSFIKKIIPQLKKYNLSYCIKIVSSVFNKSLKHKIFDFFFDSKKQTAEELEQYRFSHGLENADLLLRTPIDSHEYERLIQNSKCILDDQRDTQSGLSARFMWALGNKKKILTTNKHAFDYSFVNNNQVAVIDKFNPIIPIDFIKDTIDLSETADVSFVRIDNWVKEILS